MFSRLCRLCHKNLDIPRYNLRKYRVSSVLSQEDVVVESEPYEERKRVPVIVCKRPQFNFYEGTTYTKFETMPLASDGWHHSKSAGDYFTIYPIERPHVAGDSIFEDTTDFEQFLLHPKLKENLGYNNIYKPTEIQTVGIPLILAGKNSIVSAETGCGKTLAYLLPVLNQIRKWKSHKLAFDRGPNKPFCLIITPSRELATQIGHVAKNMAKGLDIDVATVTGGRTKKMMLNPQNRDVDLLIGTFGVMSKLITTSIFKLDFVKHVVLDEAHALFDETFEPKLRALLKKIPFNNSGDFEEDEVFPFNAQLTLVSATTPSELPEFLSDIVDIKSLTNISTSNAHRVMVPQKFMRLAAADKPMALLKLVKRKALKKHSFIIFSNDSATCDWISMFFNEFNIRTIHLNGDMPRFHREGQFAQFQKGEFNVLSTTNAGARGLDTVSVNDVINYDLPMDTADYVHRCGRTGRIGTKGDCRVTNLISRPLEIHLTQKIERATRRMRPLPMFNLLDEHIDLHKKKKKQNVPVKKSRRRRKNQSQEDQSRNASG